MPGTELILASRGLSIVFRTARGSCALGEENVLSGLEPGIDGDRIPGLPVR